MVRPNCKTKRPYVVNIQKLQIFKLIGSIPLLKSMISKERLHAGEYFRIVHCVVGCSEFDKLEIIGIKKFRNLISESDLTFPNATTLVKLTTFESTTTILHDKLYIAYAVRIQFNNSLFALFRVHHVQTMPERPFSIKRYCQKVDLKTFEISEIEASFGGVVKVQGQSDNKIKYSLPDGEIGLLNTDDI